MGARATNFAVVRLKPRRTLVGLELPDASLKLDPKPSALSSVKGAGDAGIVIPVGAYRFRNLRAS